LQFRKTSSLTKSWRWKCPSCRPMALTCRPPQTTTWFTLLCHKPTEQETHHSLSSPREESREVQKRCFHFGKTPIFSLLWWNGSEQN